MIYQSNLHATEEPVVPCEFAAFQAERPSRAAGSVHERLQPRPEMGMFHMDVFTRVGRTRQVGSLVRCAELLLLLCALPAQTRAAPPEAKPATGSLASPPAATIEGERATPAPPVQVTPPSPSAFRCLRKLRPQRLAEGADLPTDCGGAQMVHTACATRCDGRCWLRGDFDGDDEASEVAVAQVQQGDATLWILRAGAARSWNPAAHFPIADVDDVALVSATRAEEVAEASAAVAGQAPHLKLGPTDTFSFGLVTWKRGDGGWDGRMHAVVFNRKTATYYLTPITDLEASY
jgi:hypothetical protein